MNKLKKKIVSNILKERTNRVTTFLASVFLLVAPHDRNDLMQPCSATFWVRQNHHIIRPEL